MTNVPEDHTSEEIRDAFQINGEAVRGHLDELVRSTVEETLNQMLDAEADQLCGAKRYERSPDRVDSRAGSYSRKLHTKAGEVDLKVPRLRSLPFETQIIERYKRRESSVEEALVEMYLVGVSVRRVEDIAEALWGIRFSSSTVSELNQKIYERIDAWRNRPLEGEHPYMMLDGIWLKRSWGGEVKNVAVLVAVGVRSDGHREILGVAEGTKEDSESWRTFLRYLKERGLQGVRLITSDKCLGLVEALGEFFPEAAWQRCIVHFYRNVLKDVPRGKSRDVAAMLKAVHAQEDRAAAQEKAELVTEKLTSLRLGASAKCFREGVEETLAYMAFPREHWTRLRSNNMLERIMKEIRRRTRVVGAFPDGQSALMLVAARLRHIAGTKWGTRRYLDMDRLDEPSEAGEALT
ncbi:IS256 family transposase [Bremerella alba]|uniref:Mutator family transposase n=1 Tax=Bremerella alba TaxID=980252 RepID=A0A7V9A9Y6_9BACT|nr:IS256 family transposase [Bremerella alba]MBA2118025.1 IS256 family transposase ISCce2 [Bremerella alba]